MEWTVPDLVNDVFRGDTALEMQRPFLLSFPKKHPPQPGPVSPPAGGPTAGEGSIEGTVNLLGGLPQDWGSCAEQGMTGRICQRLGNEDGVGFAPSENRD
jgi:hypothetical protein